jgi:hypothetical protein
MTELRLHNHRSVETVFDLLGDREDNITYSVGWALAQSESFARCLLTEAFGDQGQGDLTMIRLQETEQGTGRTDIEIETEHLHLVLEAKRGWILPLLPQIEQYAERLLEHDERAGHILVVAECSADYPPVQSLPDSVFGIPVSYLSWEKVASLVGQSAATSRTHAEKRLLLELHRYLRGLMTMQDVTSNLVYVVVLGQGPLDWSSLTFKETVVDRGFYYHPAAGKWPHTPPNYMGFRFDGRLQQIRHVERYEVITQPHDYIPEIIPEEDWSNEPHFLYWLGPVIEPPKPVTNGKIYPNGRVWCALDLLLTCETISEARDKTQKRLAAVGAG